MAAVRKTGNLHLPTGQKIGEIEEEQPNENWGNKLIAQSAQHFDLEEPEPEETPLDRLAMMLQSSGVEDRAELKVYKSIDGVMAYCKSYTPNEFENGGYELIRRQCGHGKYELKLYGIADNGKFCIRARQPLVIAQMMGEEKPETSSAKDNQVLSALEMMMRTQSEMLKAITEKPAQQDPMQQMTTMLGMMTAMREAMGLNMQQAKQEKSSIGEIVDAIKELKSVNSLLGDKSESDDDSPTKILGQIVDIVKNTNNNQNPPARLRQMPPAIQQNPIEQSQSQPETNDMNFIEMAKLKMNFDSLLKMAAENKPHQEGADLIYEKLPDEMIEILAHESWFDMLAQYMPDAVKHKEWLTIARDLSIKMFEEPDESSEVDQAPATA